MAKCKYGVTFWSKNFVSNMHVFMYFLKQYTLYFMENRVSFVEINVYWEKIHAIEKNPARL